MFNLGNRNRTSLSESLVSADSLMTSDIENSEPTTLIEIPKRPSWWDKRTKLEKILVILFVIALLTSLAFLIVDIVPGPSGSTKGEILKSEENYATPTQTNITSAISKGQQTHTTPIQTIKTTGRPTTTTTTTSEQTHTTPIQTSSTTESKSDVVSPTQKPDFPATQGKLCLSEKCILSATNLLQSINPDEKPCEDFYEYACGNWKKEHPHPDDLNSYDWITKKTREIQHNVRDFLRKNLTDEPDAWKKAKALFRNCLDTDKLDSLEMEPVFEILKMIDLPEKPTLPFYLPMYEYEINPMSNWLTVAAKAKKLLSIDLFVGFDLEPILKPNTNNIILGMPRKTHFLPEIREPEENTHDLLSSISHRKKEGKIQRARISRPNEYLIYMLTILKFIYEDESVKDIATATVLMTELELDLVKGPPTNVSEIVIEHLKELPQMSHSNQNSTGTQHGDLYEISIDTLQNFTDIWSNGNVVTNWTEYFSVLYEGVNGVNIKGNDTVIINGLSYLMNLVRLISRSPRELTESVIWWKIVDSMVGHVDWKMRYTTKKYFEKITDTEVIESRSMVCTKVVMYSMSMAVMSFSANSEFLTTTNKTIHEMYTNIKDAFTTIVNSSTWLDNDEKKSISEKVDNITITTGYPQWLLDKKEVDEYYKGVEILNGQFLLSAANITRWMMAKKLASLATGPLTDEYSINPTSINAYYSSFHSSITFLAGFLQFPLYDLGHDALNYGITGYAAAHELNHAFDSTGIRYKNGERGFWWNESFVLEFLDRRQCFIQHYSKYGWDDDLTVDGILTVNENMADNGGLHASLLAYQKILKEKTFELELPGLTNYTSEQLFFLSFANFFCSDETEAGDEESLYDVHTPLRWRLIGSVTNSKEFSRIWNCAKGTKMNPNEEKCDLW